MHIEPTIVFPVVYVLKLMDDKYYVGITSNFNYRYSQHLQGCGAKWTRMYRPIEIISVCVGDEDKENELTLEMMKLHGWKNVRGGYWCRIDLKTNPLDKITIDDIDDA